MPFAVFRRHQKVLLAVLAIMAMFAFVIADALPNIGRLGIGSGGTNPVVVELYGKSVRMNDIIAMRQERQIANSFMERLSQRFGQYQPRAFGPLTTRDLVDALVLQHEADKLGMPATPAMAVAWLKDQTQGIMDDALFESIRKNAFENQYTGEAVLSAIANQLRLNQVIMLPGAPLLTPLDVFRSYRDQFERITVNYVPFPVADFVGQVKDPSPDQVRQFYEKYRDALPDPARSTPGFKVPRRIQVEALSLNVDELAGRLRDALTDEVLRAEYESRKEEPLIKLPPLEVLPDDLFAHNPELTPVPKGQEAKPEPQYRPFADVRQQLADDLAEKQAQAEATHMFDVVRNEVMGPYSDAIFEATKEDEPGSAPANGTNLPPAPDLKPNPSGLVLSYPDKKPLPDTSGLTYEKSPLLSREEGEHYQPLAEAHLGSERFGQDRGFAEELFSPELPEYTSVELSDLLGRRYLVWKVEDQAPRIPPLEEIREQVISAWKLDQARPLAKNAAEDLASAARQHEGDLKAAAPQDRPVMTIAHVTKLTAIPQTNPYVPPQPPRLSEISQIPFAGPELRQALFSLQPGAVVVAANQPENTYYVLAYKDRIPATFASLYTPYGPFRSLQSEALNAAMISRIQSWLAQLRTEAGLKPDWVPPEEAEHKANHPGE